MITRTLGCSSRKFARLRLDHPDVGLFAQALYPLLVACSDDFGRQQADAFTVKHAVWSTAPEPEATFEAAMDAMQHVGLIERYQAKGGIYLQIVDFEAHQQGLHKRTDSKFPEPPEIPGDSLLRELNLTEGKGTVARAPSGSALTGGLPREHLRCAACDPTFSRCVPEAVHGKLMNLLAPQHGGDREEASRALQAWYPTVWASLPAMFVMGDAFRFWQGRFDAAFATVDPRPDRPQAPTSRVPSAADTAAMLREKQR